MVVIWKSNKLRRYWKSQTKAPKSAAQLETSCTTILTGSIKKKTCSYKERQFQNRCEENRCRVSHIGLSSDDRNKRQEREKRTVTKRITACIELQPFDSPFKFENVSRIRCSRSFALAQIKTNNYGGRANGNRGGRAMIIIIMIRE